MIWNSRKPKTVEIDGVKWTIKPFNAIENTEFIGNLMVQPESADGRVRHIYETLEWILKTAVKDIEGLKDENGGNVIFGSIPNSEFVHGFSMDDFDSLCKALIEVNTTPEDIKKKSLQQPESGTDT